MREQAYSEPTLDVDTTSDGGSTAPGEVFIHELTHVWDAFHSGPTWEWEWEALLAQLNRPDGPPAASRRWTELNVEHKAMAIARWFRRYSQNPEGLDGSTSPMPSISATSSAGRRRPPASQ